MSVHIELLDHEFTSRHISKGALLFWKEIETKSQFLANTEVELFCVGTCATIEIETHRQMKINASGGRVVLTKRNATHSREEISVRISDAHFNQESRAGDDENPMILLANILRMWNPTTTPSGRGNFV